MLLNFVLFEVIVAFAGVYGYVDINNQERFSKVRYLVASENGLTNYKSRPIFQWDAPVTEISNSITTDNTTIAITEPPLKPETKKERKLRRNGERRRRRLRKQKRMQEMQNNVVQGDQTETTTTRPKKRRNRKRKKNRRLKKQRQKLENSNILEVTTAKSVNHTGNFNNLTLNDLINKLNKNPEMNLDNLRNETTVPFDKNNFTRIDNVKQIQLNEISGKSKVYVNLQVIDDKKKKRKHRKRSRCMYLNGGCSQICHEKGKKRCSCIEGFYMDVDNKTCIDIDECQANVGNCHNCRNIIGSFECTCSAGYRLNTNGTSCEDINECLLRNGHGPCQDTCTNTLGSYTCSCTNLNGTILGDDKHSCVDIDECASGKAGCSHTCINTMGQAFCTCPDGMELSPDWKTCQDVNECDDEQIKKNCNGKCVNTEGSFRCIDLSEFQNDQINLSTCKPLYPPSKGYFKCSRDGAFKAISKKGRLRVINSPRTICWLECPTGYKLNREYLITCGINGKWHGNTKGKCKKADPPLIKCPPDQNVSLGKESDVVAVKFEAPASNLNVKHIKSFPKWAEKFSGKVGEGVHYIQFRVKDPATKLTASCSFKIKVEK